MQANIDTSGTGQSGGPYTYTLYNAVNGNIVTTFNSPALTQQFTSLFSGLYCLQVFDQANSNFCDLFPNIFNTISIISSVSGLGISTLFVTFNFKSLQKVIPQRY